MGTRVTSKGQVTIPLEVREAAGIGAGAELDWVYDAGGQRLIATQTGKSGPDVAARIRRVRGIASGGMTTGDILALTRPDDTG